MPLYCQLVFISLASLLQQIKCKYDSLGYMETARVCGSLTNEKEDEGNYCYIGMQALEKVNKS